MTTLQKAIDDWHALEDENAYQTDQIKHLQDCLNRVNAELLYLKEELERLRQEKDRYQRYSVEVSTRLSTIKETIIIAESESRQYAMKPPVPNTEPDILSINEFAELKDIVSRLPPNKFNN